MKGGRITTIDGGDTNPVTGGYICAKVRRFDRRVYGDDRLHFPAVRLGAKGEGRFKRVSWNDALDHIAERLTAIRAESGGEAILPLCYGGSNGYLTQDNADAHALPPARRRAPGAHRVRRADRRGQPGALRQDGVGRLPGLPRGARSSCSGASTRRRRAST